MKKSGFGAPKPLPGQPGYKVSVSDTLERENKEMEENLKILKERMEQQEASEAKLASTGTRWKSARGDGSIRAYAKDVQEKHKKKLIAKPDPSTRATAAARRTARESKSSGDFTSKFVENWTVSDVGDWLQSMMLGQYASIFAANQISGPVLLDISLEDLDYMEIKALGHRKIILKGIEDLRQNKRVTKQLFASTEQPSAAPNANSNSGGPRSSEGRRHQQPIAAAAPPAATAATKVHWSHLEPLSTNPVSGGELPINGADAGNLDEEAERRAFQAAVMEWRNGGATTEKGIKTMSIRGGSSGTGSGNDGMWNNPFADPSPSDQKMASGDEDALDEEAERRAFQAAVMEWRNSGKTTAASTLDDSDDNMTKDYSDLWANPYAPSKSSAVGVGGEDEESYVISSARSERNLKSSGGRSLADGMLDEQREQAEFRAAVEAWRTGKSNPSLSVQTTAQRLAAELDREHESTASRYTEYQQKMKQRIEEAARELEETKQRIQEAAPVTDHLEDIEDNDHDGNGDIEDDGGHLSPCSSMGDMAEDHEDHDPQCQSHVEVSLLESHLNLGMDLTGKGAIDETLEYCVSEPPSDDEAEDDGEGKWESKYGQIDVIEIQSSN